MRFTKITALRDWLVLCTLAFGLTLGTTFSIVFRNELTIPRDIILLYWTCMGGGFCCGGLFFAFTWIVGKLKKGKGE